MRIIMRDRPRFNQWYLSKNAKWSFKYLSFAFPWNNKLYFFKIAVWAKYNFDHEDLMSVIKSKTSSKPERKIEGFDLGVVSLYTFKKDEKANEG